MSDDEHIDHNKLQRRYLVHYDSSMGPRFGVEVHSSEQQAQSDADLFRADGYPARVMEVTVEDGQPVARWLS